MKFCQSCGMPLTDDVLGSNADGSKNEDYCMYCYKDGKFLQDCTMDEMIEHCAQFVGAVNEGVPNPITKEEYIGQMKMYFPHLKRWRKALAINDDDARYNGGADGCQEQGDDLARWRYTVLSCRCDRSQLLRSEVHRHRWPLI